MEPFSLRGAAERPGFPIVRAGTAQAEGVQPFWPRNSVSIKIIVKTVGFFIVRMIRNSFVMAFMNVKTEGKIKNQQCHNNRCAFNLF